MYRALLKSGNRNINNEFEARRNNKDKENREAKQEIDSRDETGFK